MTRQVRSTSYMPGAGIAASADARPYLPRIATAPLAELTPATSFGYDVIEFAERVLGETVLPWQRWLLIHLGELLPDGRPRFRHVLVLVARQNGKTRVARWLVLYWLFVERVEFVLTTSTDRSYAKKAWEATNLVIKGCPALAAQLGRIRLTISEEATITRRGSELGFAANNASAGRSRTISRALIDEVREHDDLDAWGAITGAMNAVPYGQVVAISNQGDDTAVLLDALRDPAVAFIETGEGDPRLGLFEWSALPGADPTDLDALAAANPSPLVGLDDLAAVGRRAELAGGIELAGFRTEVMCQRVELLDPAIDAAAWSACAHADPIDLAAHRGRVALCLDVATDETHATLVAAATIGGVTHVEVVAAWERLDAVRRELPALVERIRPGRLGWLPAGPAAALAADLAERRAGGWPPRRVELTPIKSDTAAVCMALPSLVASGAIRHGADPMLDAHVARAQRLRRGDAWVFGRRGAGAVDGVYALAGAIHLARTMPPPRAPLAIA